MSKQKSKIRFNIVDFLVIAAVLLVVVGVVYKVLNQQVSQAFSPTVKIEMTAVLRNAHDYVLEYTEQETFPAQMVAGNSAVSDCYVTGYYIRPFVQAVEQPDGTVKNVEVPDRYDIYYTCEAELPRDNAVYKMGSQEVRAGKSFILKTNLLEVTTAVSDIKVVG